MRFPSWALKALSRALPGSAFHTRGVLGIRHAPLLQQSLLSCDGTTARDRRNALRKGAKVGAGPAVASPRSGPTQSPARGWNWHVDRNSLQNRGREERLGPV